MSGHHHYSIHTVCAFMCVHALFFLPLLSSLSVFWGVYVRFLWSKRSLFVTFNTGLPLMELPSIQNMKRLAHILAVSHSATALLLLSPCVTLPPPVCLLVEIISPSLHICALHFLLSHLSFLLSSYFSFMPTMYFSHCFWVRSTLCKLIFSI